MIFTGALIIIAMTVAVGYPAQRLWFRRALDPALELPLAMTLGMLIVAHIQFVTFLTGEPAWLVNGVLYAAVLAGLWGWARHRQVPRRRLPWNLLVLMTAFLMYGVALMMLEPSYDTGFNSDWSYYYPNVSYYLHEISEFHTTRTVRLEYLVKRTPLMTVYGAFFHSFFGLSYAWFQIATSFANAMVLMAVWGVASQFGGARARWLALLLLPIQPFLTRLTFLPMPKLMAAAFLVLGLAIYIQWRNDPDREPAIGRERLIAYGICCAASLMSHPSMLAYLIVIPADQLYLAWRRRQVSGAFWGISAAVGAALVLPWLIWVMFEFGFREALTPTGTLSSGVTTYDPHFFRTRLLMIGTTLVLPSPIYLTWQHLGLNVTWEQGIIPWGHALLRVYWDTFAGGLTFSGCLWLAVAVVWRRRTAPIAPAARIILVVCLLGAFGCLLLHFFPEDKGLAATIMTPLLLAVYLYACSRWAALPGWSLAVLVAGVAIEFAVTRWLVWRLTRDLDVRLFEYVYDLARHSLPALVPGALLLIAVTLAAYYATLCRLWRQDRPVASDAATPRA